MDRTAADRVSEWWETAKPISFLISEERARELLVALFDLHAADAKLDAVRECRAGINEAIGRAG